MIKLISKIIEVVIKLVVFILELIFTIIIGLFPEFQVTALATGITAFFGLMENAVNMTYFLVGPGMYIYLDIIIILWTTKHTILPLVSFVRRLLVHN